MQCSSLCANRRSARLTKARDATPPSAYPSDCNLLRLWPFHLPITRVTWRRRPALLLQQLRSSDARVTFRSYAPADILLVLMQNGGATQSDADGGGAVSLLDMCYQAIVLLNGEYEGMRAAKDNPQSFQRRLRVRVHPNIPQQAPLTDPSVPQQPNPAYSCVCVT